MKRRLIEITFIFLIFVPIMCLRGVYYKLLVTLINLLLLISIILFLSVVSQLGNLVFSLIKRYYNRKDFLSILFNHGGILDRFDNINQIYFVISRL